MSLAIVSVILGSTHTYNAYASELSYTVETVLPSNQIDKKQSYFDLKMATNQKQVLKIHMRNGTSREIKITPTISPATTNSNGVVEYGPSQTKLDSTAPYNIKDLVKSSTKEITIPAHSSTDYKLNVTMPDRAYDGIVAGGIYFEEKKHNSQEDKQKSGLALENHFSYVVAVLLKETDKPINPEITLLRVRPGQVNARNVINAELKNSQATYINQLKVQTDVKRKYSNDILYKSSTSAMQMAPNTTLTYPTPLDGEKLKPGVYTMHVVANSGKKQWEFNKDFTISGTKARELNEKDVSIKHDYSWLYVLTGVLLLFLAFTLIFFILWNRKSKKTGELKNLKKEIENDSAKNE